MCEHFGGVFYINLDKRADRRVLMEKELELIGLSGERFVGLERSPGIVGCGYSHLSVLVEARNRGLPNVLIFEDDILLSPKFNEYLEQTLKKIPSDWDMIVLGYGHEKYFAEPEGEIRKIKRFTGCYAYIVNPASLGKIMPYFSLPGEPVDTILEDLTSRSLITIYAPYNRIVETGNEKSTILP